MPPVLELAASKPPFVLTMQACEDGDGSLRKALWAQSEKLVAEAGLVLPERLLERCEAAPVV